jgi:putative heme-binding domain-containing protein
LGDSRTVTPALRESLIDLARNETNAPLRGQLASTAKRLPADDALPIIRELLLRNEDARDTCIPLLEWWAIENKAITNRDSVLEMFCDERLRHSALVTNTILERLARRYAAENDVDACMRLLRVSHSIAQAAPVLKGIEAGLARVTNLPPSFAQWIDSLSAESQKDIRVVRLGVRLHHPPSEQAAQTLIIDEKVPKADRISLIESLGKNGDAKFLPVFITTLRETKSDMIRAAAVVALEHYSDTSIGAELIALYPRAQPAMRPQIINALATRPAWSSQLVSAVEGKTIPAKDIALDNVRQMGTSKELLPQIEKIWGKIQSKSPAEKQSTINRLKLVVRPSGAAGRDPTGNPGRGKKLFEKTCAVCHTLFGEGNKVGPDLTGIDRKNLDYLLLNIVNPSASIRPEFVNFEIETKDEQNLSGLIVESSPSSVTVLDRNNQKHTIPRDNLHSMRESQLSLMPEGLLEALEPKELMDLFAYLQKDGK